MNTQTRIQRILQEKFSPSFLDVVDDSAAHAGHLEEEAGHYTVIVVSDAFKDRNPVERHQLVYKALDGLKDQIHALRIRALSLEEYAS